MSLKDSTLLADANLAPTGGVVEWTFVPNGITIPNGSQFIIAEHDLANRAVVTCKVRPAARNPKTGSYTKEKKEVVISQPFSLSNGELYYETFRLIRESHPATEPAARTAIQTIASQLISSSAMTSFWDRGSAE